MMSRDTNLILSGLWVSVSFLVATDLADAQLPQPYELCTELSCAQFLSEGLA